MRIKTSLYDFINENASTRLYYHGSEYEFDEFDLKNNKGYQEIDIPTWFFTENIDYAKTYGKYLYTVELTVSNTFDLSIPAHYDMFIDTLHFYSKTASEILDILDEQIYDDLPYWTCDDAFVTAITYEFDSILIQEELEGEVLSIGVFSVDDIKIIKRE